MFRKIFIQLLMLGLLAGVLVLAGCGTKKITADQPKPEEAEPPAKIKIATINGPSAMSMVKLIEEKPALGEEVEAEYMVKDNPELVKAMLLQGEADIATVPATLAAVLYNKGVQYQAAAITVWGTLYLVGEDPEIKSWEDLKGQRIFTMGKGLTPDVVFKHLLRKKGLAPEQEVVLDYSFPMPADLGNAVSAGKAKLAVLSEPMASVVLAKNKNLRVIMDLNKEWDQAEGSIPMAQTCVFVKKEFAQKYPAALQAYLDKYRESAEWVNGNPDRAGALIAKHKILPNPKLAAASIPRSNIRYEDAGSVRDGIEAYLKLFYDYDPKIVGGKLPDEGFYYKR